MLWTAVFCAKAAGMAKQLSTSSTIFFVIFIVSPYGIYQPALKIKRGEASPTPFF
jgi:hypothetical protein